MAIVKDGNGNISMDIIEKYEQKWGVKLPEEYRKFLSTYNGGYPFPDAFAIADIEDESTVDRFLQLGAGPHSNLEKYMTTYTGRLPNDLFPIAHDPGGNLICIGIDGDCFGKIYFWDHEFEADENEPDYSNVYLIADSFIEFLENLYELELY